nr:TIGR02302 family protein [Alkalilacustris brevis]
MSETDENIQAAHAQLKWPLRLTWAGLFAERFTRAFWPVWSLVFLLVAVLAFGLLDTAPLELIWSGTVLWVLAVFGFLLAGLWRFRWPRRAEAMRRLDQTLPGQPLAALADQQAIGAGDMESVDVWRVHLQRMAARASAARPVAPDLRLARRDPFALRYVALLAFVLAMAFGSAERLGDMQSMTPAPMRFDAQAAGISWEAWIQPPAYTGRPSLYLNEVDRPALEVPAGSRATVRLYGQSGVLTLAESVTGDDDLVEDPAAPSHELEITRAGRIAIQGPGGRSWELSVLSDAPPTVRLAGEMTREARGVMNQRFEASDDYGVVSGSAEIRLDLAAVERRYGLAPEPEARAPIEVDLPMPVAGARDDFAEVLIEDFSQHPWANMPVTIQLTVKDARDQAGQSAPREAVLPGRRFFDPMAAAIVEMRRDLMWNRESAPRVAQVLRAVSHRPDEGFRNERAYLQLRVALRQLEAEMQGGLSEAARDEVAGALWEIALLVEEGDLADALERLRRAQERLAEAMRNGADPSEIAELMDELREAMRDYMRQLAEQGGGEEQDFAEGERMEITGDQLQALMDRIQELMEEGRMAEAMELLEQLNAMMENMQVTQGEGGAGGGPGQQSLEGLGDTLRDQQELSDDTFRDLQERFGDMAPGQPPMGEQPGGEQGEGDGAGEGSATPGTGSLTERQQALREQLRGLEDQPLPGEGTDSGDAAREALDEAGRAMERAEDALREGDGAAALDRQSEAIEALREGLRNMGEAIAQEQGQPGSEGSAQAGDMGEQNRDPLGREAGRLGRIGTDDSMLQDGELQDRAREILDEIRRRSGDQTRPEIELDYLRRLLERF